ncbi:MAG: iron-containing alcohol dehydrogenase [Clostridia bacterium]|nr:iron-containing alcohol dehydrogenase [Clostridia bacterium]
MNSFEYYNPVRVVFGEQTLNRVGETVAAYGKQALLVSYRNVSFMTKTIDRIHNLLERSGVSCVDCFVASANPLIEEAREGIELGKKHGVDVVIGLGGGSAMDCAKAISAGLLYGEQDIRNMFVFSHTEVKHIPPVKALPMVMIPTLPATGSEMNLCAVLTDGSTRRKSYIWAECLYPQVAIIDPEMTVSLPPYQTACGAIDTIAHVAEAYFNGNDSNLILQDKMEEGVIRSVMETLPVVMENPNDLQARGVMLWAASIALNGWVNSGTMIFTPMHQLGHVLSARFGATHGATLACLMPAWMRFRAAQGGEAARRCEQFARKIFDCPLLEAADKFEAWMRSFGVQTRISEFGVTKDDVAALAEQVREISFNGDDVLGSYPAITLEDVKTVYTLAL